MVSGKPYSSLCSGFFVFDGLATVFELQKCGFFVDHILRAMRAVSIVKNKVVW